MLARRKTIVEWCVPDAALRLIPKRGKFMQLLDLKMAEAEREISAKFREYVDEALRRDFPEWL